MNKVNVEINEMMKVTLKLILHEAQGCNLQYNLGKKHEMN